MPYRIRLLLTLTFAVGASFPATLSASTIVAWGNNNAGQTNFPIGLTDAVLLAGGDTHSLALLRDGTIVGCGDNTYGKVTGAPGLTGIVSIGAGAWHSIALHSEGRVVVWGQSQFGQTAIPIGLSGVVAIAAGSHHNLALTSSGRVIAWGYDNSGQSTVPTNLVSVTAIAAGYAHSIALKSDGSVICWGSLNQTSVPAGLTNVAAIAAGLSHNLALKLDGSVVSWGSMNQGSVPPGLSGVVEIAAGADYSLALRDDGTVVSWGNLTVPAGLSNVTSIAAGWSHGLALIGGITNSTPSILGPFGGRAYIGTPFTFRVLGKGTGPLEYQWRKDEFPILGETNSVLNITSLKPSDAGNYSVVVNNSFGAASSRVARLSVVGFGAPEIRADLETLIENVTRGDRSTISMLSPFPNATIFYTTNGTPPNVASTPYQGPFVISQTLTIRAIAYNQDFTEVAEDGPFQIEILPTHPLTTATQGSGVLSIFPDYPRHILGSRVRVWAFPAPGWHFLRWSGDACDSTAVAAVIMDGDKAITAIFEPNPLYTLTTASGGGGSVSGNGAGVYTNGTVVTLIPQPQTGWQFLQWEGDGVGSTVPMSVTIDRHKTIRAVFGTSVTTSIGGLGVVGRHPQQALYPYGSIVRLFPKPNDGSYFAVWGSAASGRSSPLDFVITTAQPTISALFLPLQSGDVNVYVEVQGEGTVAASPNQQPYSPGSLVTVTARPAPGWRFIQWEGDLSGGSSTTNILLNANKNVKAIFETLPRFSLVTTNVGGVSSRATTAVPTLKETWSNWWPSRIQGGSFSGGTAMGVERPLIFRSSSMGLSGCLQTLGPRRSFRMP